jgi:phosphoribosyl-ATP pyrophosphohydrolase
MDVLDRLEATIRARRGTDASASYVASLFAKGRGKIAQKVGEEAVETAIAAVSDPARLVPEAADLVFHLLVLLAASGATLDEVRAELARREGLSGHDEKAARGPEPTAAADPSAPSPFGPLPLAGLATEKPDAGGLPLKRAGPILPDQ